MKKGLRLCLTQPTLCHTNHEGIPDLMKKGLRLTVYREKHNIGLKEYLT